ncbi:membrane protein [Clostridium acetobutylicum]|nr:membrane protein [Clostridium acetobutylicum]
MRKRDIKLFDHKEKTVYDYMIINSRPKLLLGLIFIPPFILIFILAICCIVKNVTKVLTFESVGGIFFGGCFMMFIFVELIDMIQATTREFIHDDKKGKLISLIIFLTFLFKELFEIAHHHR